MTTTIVDVDALEAAGADALYNILWDMPEEKYQTIRKYVDSETHPVLIEAMRHNDERVRWMKEGIDGH